MKKLILTLLGVVLGVSLWAQQLDPVKWAYRVDEVSPTEAELVFTAKLDDGWHLYSQYTDPNGPWAIVFEFTVGTEYQHVGKVREPKPH